MKYVGQHLLNVGDFTSLQNDHQGGQVLGYVAEQSAVPLARPALELPTKGAGRLWQGRLQPLSARHHPAARLPEGDSRQTGLLLPQCHL